MTDDPSKAILENDVVAFTETIPKDESTGTWPAGTEGTVVSDFGDHKMVEISDADNYGATLDMPTVPVEKLKLITKYNLGINAAVTNISRHGFRVLLDERELFLAFEEYPWFRRAPVEAILRLERPQPDHLRWPDLDIDLSVDSIEHPERYPLKAKS
jgi:hypothetical protein